MEFKNFDQVFDWLWQDKKYIPEKRQERLAFALEFFSHPEKDLPAIHITGTNGKGSTLAFLRDLLKSQDLKVASFSSPHIVTCTERLTMDGRNISDQQMLGLFNQMIPLTQELEMRGLGPLVEFEMYTLMFLLYCRHEKPDVCVIEVGIGGRDDATNVVDAQVAVLTSIGLDHADRLGDTLASVAEIKSAIIKEKAKVIIGQLPAETMPIIEERVSHCLANLNRYQADFKANLIEEKGPQGTSFNYLGRSGQSHPIEISLLGLHQVDNASLALASFEAWMQIKGLEIDWEAACQAIKQTQWMARLEKIASQPYIYIDGAHNLHGIMALKEAIETYFKNYQIDLLYAGLTTKDQSQQVPFMLEFPIEKLYLTSFNHPKAMQAQDFDQLKELFSVEQSNDILWVDDWQTFVSHYQRVNAHDHKHFLLITGSLYFVSQVREFVTGQIAKY